MSFGERLSHKHKIMTFSNPKEDAFLAQLAEGQQAIVMALCP